MAPLSTIVLTLLATTVLFQSITSVEGVRTKRRLKKGKKGGGGESACDPADVNLADYVQWQNEVGYWVGEYSFYGADGAPFISASWNYPYDHYKGFVTGNIKGNAYRQRNVFLYPPQTAEKCEVDDTTTGDGVCGVNGNTKMFMADQSATTCSDDPDKGGIIEGPYMGVFNTKTELVGKDNALLYQVFFNKDVFQLDDDSINQSQLTTINTNAANETIRVRTAQGYGLDGNPQYASFYRETRVTKEAFYTMFNETLANYAIQSSDTCDGAGYEGCVAHLEESFEL